jgi:hypothetical protein
MDGVAPDHASQRDRGVIGLAVLRGGIERDRDGGWNFQRPGHGDDLVTDAGRLQLGDRAFQQRILDVVIETRLDDQRMRAGNVGLVLQLCAPRVRHLVPVNIEEFVRVLGAAATKAKGCVYFISDSRAA